jgi:hypothetical protein
VRNRTLFIVSAVVLTAFPALGANGGVIIEGDPSDAYIDQNGVNDGKYSHQYAYSVGGLFGSDMAVMVEPFALPYLAPGQQVTGATISFYVEQPNGTENYNMQLYGLNRVSATSPMPLTSDWYVGSNDTANTLLNASFVTPSTPINQAVTYSGGNLVSFIQKQYANSAFSGLDLSTTRYIFFRLSPGATSLYNYYEFAGARNPNRAFHPQLSLTISGGVSNLAGRLQFSFNLPTAAVTSAGVYNPATGALIRTLWNNVQYNAGTSYGVWDGKDDSGTPVAAGSPYQVKMIYHNVQYIWEGMVGNTSAAQSGPDVYHSFLPIMDMAVGGNTVYSAVGYNENGNPLHYFTVGSPQVPIGMVGPNYSDVNSNIGFVASDGTRSYWAKGTGGMTGIDTYVIAFAAPTDAYTYTFPQGTNPPGGNPNQAYTSCIDFDSAANQPNPATGLAVQKSGNALFVSHGNLNLVRVFDKVQGNLLGTFSVTKPGRMTVTASGDVWVISHASTPVVQRYSFANGAATLKQTITGLAGPAGLGVSADDALLLIADGGTSQQVKAYNNSTGALMWTYGKVGGMPANGADINTSTFDFSNTMSSGVNSDNSSFITFQSDNTFWIDDGGNGRVLHFSINGNTPVYIEQIAYNACSYQSTVDLTDATRVFNNFMEYSVNYALPLGGTNGSWTMTKNWAFGLPNDSTHNYFGYCNGLNNVVTLPNGHTYGFMQNYVSGLMDLFELPATGAARPTGYTFLNVPRIYPDGTLRFNVSGSSSLSFYSAPLTGFDAKNNPVWGSPALVASTATVAGDPVSWNPYPERTEITATGKVIDYDGDKGDTGYHLGAIQSGGSAWLWRSCPSVNGSPWFPQDGHFDIGDGVQYAGNYGMALGRNIVCGYHGELWCGGEASQWLNFFDNGLMVGRFGTYANLTTLGPNTVDGYAGNSFAPTLVHGPNGKTYLYHNDESNHGGTCRWQIAGWDGITEISGSSVIGGIANLSSASAPSVSLTSPTAGASYPNGNNISLGADATGAGASISSVQFFDGSTSLGTVTAAPYNLNYSGLSAGTHLITAKVTDSNNATATSAAVSITVGSDGMSAPPPAPISLSSGNVAAQSITLNWAEPATSSSTSTVGQAISFQCISPGDSNALAATDVGGAVPYAASHFNALGTRATGGLIFLNPVNSQGVVVPNLGLVAGMSGGNNGTSLQALTGTTKKLFENEVATWSGHSIGITNIPYAQYDLVVYSLPYGVGGAATSIIVSDNTSTSTVQQSFTTVPTGYSVFSVPFGSNGTATNADTVVFQGMTSPYIQLQGTNICAFQIVERPYDQGTPTSFSIERATGTSGTFSAVGTASGSVSTFTDTNGLSTGSTYQYRIKAINSAGASAYSNTVTVATSGTGSNVATPATGFSSWQSRNFSTAQLTDASVSGPNADPYGSGVENLLAYALGLDPATAQTTDVPTPTIQNGHLTITYTVPSAITDVSYSVEVSADMKTWGTGTGYTQVLSSTTSSTGVTMTVQDVLPTTTQKHFMRLRVTQLP